MISQPVGEDQDQRKRVALSPLPVAGKTNGDQSEDGAAGIRRGGPMWTRAGTRG